MASAQSMNWEENKDNIPPRNLYYRDSVNSKTPESLAKKENTAALPKRSLNDYIMEMLQKKNFDLKNAQLLGKGGCSKVLSAVFEGKPVAVKVINTFRMKQEYFDKFLPREIECWKQLKHKNIVPVFGHYTAMHFVFYTMELGETDLYSFLEKNGALSEAEGKTKAIQIGNGLLYMHEKKIAHRDLKLENVILFPGGVVKLADFGFAREVPEERRLSNTYCGSKSYVAPEILLCHPHNPFKSDVWSFGVMLFIILTDHMPFREDLPRRTIVLAQQNRNYEYPPNANLSDDCRSAIDTMLTFHWAQRPNLPTALSLPWFSVPQ